VLLLLSTALCLRFLFHRADYLLGRVRHVPASPACLLRLHGLGRRRNERPPGCRDARSAARAQSPSCAAGPGQRRPQPDQHIQHLCRQQPRYGPSVPATPFVALVRVAYPIVTASVVPIVAAAILDTYASAPDTTSTTIPIAALLATPIDVYTHAVPVPSGLWPLAASVLVTGAVAAPTNDSAPSSRSLAIPAASIVAPIAASAAPVRRAALHRGQRHSRAACAKPPP
jgi:hypothetical protein